MKFATPDSLRLLLVGLCALSLLQTASAQQGVMVTFQNEAIATEALEVLAKAGGGEVHIQRLQSSAARHIAYVISNNTVAEWQAMPSVVRATRNDREVKPRDITPNDPGFAQQWNLQQIDAPGAWEYTVGGRTASGQDIAIGVIEPNGFDLDHSELRRKYFTNRDEIPNNGIDDDNNGYIDDITGWNFLEGINTFEDDRHGAHVVATLAAETNNHRQTAGLNWGAEIIPLQIDDVDDWILALDYLTLQRERFNLSNGIFGAFVVVANMSFGIDGRNCTEFPDLNDAINRAGEVGILSVGASSNMLGFISTTNPNDIPATCASEYLIAVTASDRLDEIWQESSFSPVYVDLAAPGAEFRSISYTSSDNTFEGTSGATPHVAGTVALMYALDCGSLEKLALSQPGATALLVRDLLLSSVDEVASLQNVVASGGRLNVRLALETVLREACLSDQLIVTFAAGEAAPSALTLPSGENLSRQRTLSNVWNTHLYALDDGELTATTQGLREQSGIIAVEPNVQLLLRSRTPSDPDYAIQSYAPRHGLPEAWEIVYGATEPVQPSPVITGIFDQNFKLTSTDLSGRRYENLAEIAGNGIDDDNNGFVDDRIGVVLGGRQADFSSGSHGAAVSHIVAANPDNGEGIAGVDWAGRILPLQGSSLADWVEGASYLYSLRQNYNQSNGTRGGLVVSMLVVQGAERLVHDANAAQVAEYVAAQLADEGIALVAAAPNQPTALPADFPAGVQGEMVLVAAPLDNEQKDLLQPLLDERIFYTQAGGLAYELVGTDTLMLPGSSGSAALLAGVLSLTYQAQCSELSAAADAPRMYADMVVEDMQLAAVGAGRLQADLAAEIAKLDCTELAACRVLAPPPSFVKRGNRAAAAAVSIGNEAPACSISLVDVLGREVAAPVVLPQGEQLVDFPLEDLGNGIYYFTLSSGKSVVSYPVLLID